MFNRLYLYKLISKVKINSYITSLIPLCIIFLIGFMLSFFDGCLTIEGEQKGFLEDPGLYTNLIALYFMMILAINVPLKFRDVFSTMRMKERYVEQEFTRSESIKSEDLFDSVLFSEEYTESDYTKDYDNVINQTEQRTKESRTLYNIILLSMILSYIIVQIYMFLPNSNYNWAYGGIYRKAFVGAAILNYFQWGIVYPQTVFIVIVHMFGMIKLVKLLSNNSLLKLDPVSNTSKSGISKVYGFAKYLVNIIVFALLFLFGFIFVRGFVTETLLGTVLFFLMASVVIFIPVIIIHSCLLRIKKEKLIIIERNLKNLQVEYDSILTINTDHKKLNKMTQTIENLERRHKHYSTLPVWPFRYGIPRRSVLISFFSAIFFLYNLYLVVELLIKLIPKYQNLFH